MKVKSLHPFDLPPKDAIRLQTWLAARVIRRGTLGRRPRLVAGLDCAVDRRGHVHGVVVVCAAPDWRVVETVSSSARATMPYIPGLLSFREAPILLDALRKLRSAPDLLMVDGHGYAHPRGLGLASHVGLHVDVPTIGVAKSLLVGTHPRPGLRFGDWRPLNFKGRRVGLVLTTRDRTKPVFVSIGNRIGLFPAARAVLATCTRYRIPEPVRQADIASGKLARESRVLAR